MIYEAWRITYQSSEAAARAAYNTVEKLHEENQALRKYVDVACKLRWGGRCVFPWKNLMRLVNAGELQMVVDALRRLHAENQELKEQMASIEAGGVEPLRKSTAAPQAVQAAVPVNLDFGTLREIVNGLHRAWGDAQGYAYCPGSEPYIEARQRAMSMHAGALRYIESMESYTAPAHPAEGVPAQTTRDAVIQHLTNAGVLEHDGCGIFIASGDASELIDACMALCAAAHTALATQSIRHELEQFIEQVGDVHFQRCRVGSKEGAIRWDIEFGHYDAEVSGKTLREAITKAIAAQAKRGGEA